MRQAFDTTEQCARSLDSADSLASFRKRFQLPADGIYLDGNSLGLASHDAERALLRRLDEWKRLGIRGWLEGDGPWFHCAETVGARAARLVGAKPPEVVFTGTTTINIHALVATLYEPTAGRQRILTDALAFPSDVYALRDQLRLKGADPRRDLVLVPSGDGRTIDEDDVVAGMTEEVALVLLPSVLYRSGQLLDLPRLTGAARERGIPIGFDCSHSVGAVPHRLHDWGVDYAVWCSYKYLNGGPGCSAFLYLHERHFDRRPGISGWFGADQRRRFDLDLELAHARSAAGWQISSPGILGSSTIEGSLAIFEEAGIGPVRAKSLALTEYLMFLVDELLAPAPYHFRIGTPRAAERRGGHVALERDADALRISLALRGRGIVPDFRPPNIIRIAPVALYNTFLDLFRFVQALRSIVDTAEYEQYDPTELEVP